MKRLANIIIIATSLLGSASVFSAEQEDKSQLETATPAPQATDRTNKFTPVVLPFYDPSTDAGIMAVPLYAFYPDDEDLVSDASTIGLPMFYTSNGSYMVKAFAEIILFEDQLRIVGESGFTSTNLDLLDDGIETNKESWDFTADVYYKIFEDFYLGLGTSWTNSRFVADNASEQTQLNDVGYGEDYDSDLGMRISMQWDTREHYYYPHSGFVWDLRYESHAEWMGNDADNEYSSIFSDYRHFYTVNNNTNHIIATKIVGRYLLNAEDAPSEAFSTYGRQGKEVQRGFVIGDYVASNMLNYEAEYRYSLSNTGNAILDKSSLVAIAGVGKSFGEQLDGPEIDFADSDWLTMVGVGYQYDLLPYERMKAKVDLTYNSDGDVIAYFGIGQSI